MPPPSLASVGMTSANVTGELFVVPAVNAIRPTRNEGNANAAFVHFALKPAQRAVRIVEFGLAAAFVGRRAVIGRENYQRVVVNL